MSIRPEKHSASISVKRNDADPVSSVLDAVEAALDGILPAYSGIEGTYYTIRFDPADEDPTDPGERLCATVTAQPRKAPVNKRRQEGYRG